MICAEFNPNETLQHSHTVTAYCLVFILYLFDTNAPIRPTDIVYNFINPPRRKFQGLNNNDVILMGQMHKFQVWVY